jgi:hypothetical protein
MTNPMLNAAVYEKQVREILGAYLKPDVVEVTMKTPQIGLSNVTPLDAIGVGDGPHVVGWAQKKTDAGQGR